MASENKGNDDKLVPAAYDSDNSSELTNLPITCRRAKFQTALVLSLELAPSSQSTRALLLKYFSARRLKKIQIRALYMG